MKVAIFGNGFIGHNTAIAFSGYHGAKITMVTDHPSYTLDINTIPYSMVQDLGGDVAIWATGPSTGPRECTEIGLYISKFEKFLNTLKRFRLVIYISGVMGEGSHVSLWSPYSVMHFACEGLTNLTLKNACILRVNPVYGPYQREGKLIVNAIRAKLKNEKLKVSNALTRRDFIYVKDLAQDIISYTQRFISCGEETAKVRTFNVCSGELITVETICEILGVQWVPGQYVNEPVTGFSSKVNRPSPWTNYTSIAVGLRETLQWYKTLNSMSNEPRITD